MHSSPKAQPREIFLSVQVNPRTAQPLAGRGLMSARGAPCGGRNGGGRWPLGRTGGRGMDYSGSLGSYGMGPSTGSFDMGQGYVPSVTQVGAPFWHIWAGWRGGGHQMHCADCCLSDNWIQNGY